MPDRAAVLLSLLLVLSSVAPAAAQSTTTSGPTGDHCTETEDFLFTITNGGFGQFPECKPSRLSDKINEIKDAEDNKTHADLYNSLSQQRETFESLLATRENYVKDSRTTAYLKAENATVQEMLSEPGPGSPSLAELNATADQTAMDYYTQAHQVSQLNTWNKHILGLKYIVERVRNESGLSLRDVVRLKIKDRTQEEHMDSMQFVEKQITLANGTQRDVWEINVSISVNEHADEVPVSGDRVPNIAPTQGEINASNVQGYSGSYVNDHTGIKIVPADGTALDEFEYLNFSNHVESWNKDSAAQMVTENALKNAKAMYEAEQNGQFDPANYSNPYALAQEYSTNYNSTGYWSYALASGAAMGYEVPDLNGTSLMYVEYGSNEYQGQIMSPTGPSSTNGWVTGHEYEPSSISGTQWLMRSSGDMVKLTGPFTITRMTNKTGGNITQTETVKYVYENDDAEDLERRQNLTMELIREINSREPGAGAGGGSGLPDWWPDGPLGGLGIAAAAAAVVGGLLVWRP